MTAREMLDRLRALEAEATPGPWVRWSAGGELVGVIPAGRPGGCCVRDSDDDNGDANLRLIAASRNAMPSLLAVLEAAIEWREADHNEDPRIDALLAALDAIGEDS